MPFANSFYGRAIINEYVTGPKLSFLILIQSQALKLAERTIQFADTLTVLTEGYIRAGRVSHAEGEFSPASKFYTSAIEGQPKHVLGAIGMAQMQMQNGLPLFPCSERI